MAKYRSYAVDSLPSGAAIDINGVYFRKQASQSFFTIHIRKNDNSGWVTLADIPVSMVNGLTGNVQLDLSFNTGTGVLSLTGSGVNINFDSRYFKNTDNLDWSRIVNRPTTLAGYGITDAALDTNVVHKSGAEIIGGAKSFTENPTVPTPSAGGHAANKTYVDTGDSNLQTQITALQNQVNTGVQQAVPIDCSSNPNYPAAEAGQRWRVTVAGKIGGASGIDVEQNDVIECVIDTTGGTHATVSSNFIIQQSNIDSATETTEGYVRKNTTAEALAGSNDEGVMTALKTQQKLDSTVVKFDVSQSLNNAQQVQARNNINAASQSDVNWGQKDW